jgi:hypothetical protein
MKTCASCKAQSPDDSVFCGECGAGLEAHDTSVDGSAAPAARPATPDATVPGSPLSAAMQGGAPPPPAAPAAPGVALAPPAGAPRGAPRPRHVPAGTVVDGKYRIERVLGEGGMGIVYLAVDVHTGVEVVLKAIRNELAHRPDMRERTLAEGRVIARIDHPNVVHLKAVVIDSGPPGSPREDESLWLVMQFVDGESLEERVSRHARERIPMPVPEVLRVLSQVLAGMGAVHKGGIIHRDLKPGTILIRASDGVAKVSDFGIAKGEEDARAGRGQTRGIIGSLWYMSPEQVTGRRDLDKRVDVYALGIMLYEMLVGHVPFDAEDDQEIMRMHAAKPVPLASASRADVPRALDDIIQKACAKDRDQRYPSCEAMLADIERLRAEQAPGARPAARSSGPATTADDAAPLSAPSRGRGWLVLLVAVLVIGGGAAALFASGVVALPGDDGPTAGGTAPAVAATEARPPSAAATSTASAAAPKRPLERLVGRWESDTGRTLDAVLAGDAVEFRIVDPAQFTGQDYSAGEARFVLRPDSADASTFSVEDRIRPLPPSGHTYSANARSTCLVLWAQAGGKPLRAALEGTRLAVDFVKIEPDSSNFVVESAKTVVGCRKLDALRATPLPGVLNKK